MPLIIDYLSAYQFFVFSVSDPNIWCFCLVSQVFAHFIDFEEKMVGSDLESLMITPVQRIPRYILLLKELVKAFNLITDHFMGPG